MTRKELADFLGYSTLCQVSLAVTKAKKIMPSIAIKDKRDPYALVSFSKDEILCIASCIEAPRLNPIQIELVGDNYIPHEKTYLQKRSIYIDGMEKFVERYQIRKKRKKMKCCASCAYCTGKSLASVTTKKFPYCTFYEKFIRYMRIEKFGKLRAPNIFVDKCGTYKRVLEMKIYMFKKK